MKLVKFSSILLGALALFILCERPAEAKCKSSFSLSFNFAPIIAPTRTYCEYDYVERTPCYYERTTIVRKARPVFREREVTVISRAPYYCDDYEEVVVYPRAQRVYSYWGY